MKKIITLALAVCIFWLSPVFAGPLLVEWHIANMQKDGCLKEVAAFMVKNGIICDAISHKWESGCGQPGCLVMHGGPMRHCIICGKSESAKVDWR